MNRVIISGNLAKDPELKYTPNTQMAVCTFPVALNRGKDKDGNDRGTDYPRVIVYGRTAENCDKYLAKGRKVLIEGRIRTGSYQNKEGATVYTTDVIADRVEFLGGGQQNQTQPQGQTTTYTNPDTQRAPSYATQAPAPVQQTPAEEFVPAQFETIDEDIPF